MSLILNNNRNIIIFLVNYSNSKNSKNRDNPHPRLLIRVRFNDYKDMGII